MPREACVEFPPFRLDLANHELWRGQERLTVRPKPFAVLAYLATHARRLVPHAELVNAVWPDTHVADGLLRGYVRDLRNVLGDDAAAPRFIETVARLGYRFVAPVQAPAAVPRDAGAPRSDVVGREAELRKLEQRLADAMAGTRQIVFVTGEPGIGKTTLVDAFVAQSVAGRGVRTARGQCVEHFGPTEAYLPLLEALGRLARLPRGEQVVALLARHAPTWLVQMPALVADAELETVQRRAQGATRERMLRELTEAVETLTAVEPLVLVLEDLQWSDASTLDLVSLLARRRGTARVMLLCTYRPADVIASAQPLAAIKRELQVLDHCEEVALSPLAATGVGEYLAHRFPRRRFPDDLGDVLHRATEGNPLFVVNVVDHWIAQGIVREHDGEWRLDGAPSDVGRGVPETLREMIERQLERLAPEARRVLEVASVAGPEFSTGAVAAVLEEATERVDECCERLVADGHVLRACGLDAAMPGALAGRYAFLHALYQQVLYERLAPARRARLHRRLGEWVERTFADRVHEHAAELALHFERGHEADRAMRHLEAAASNAVHKHAHREAVALLERALGLLHARPDGAERARKELALQMALGTPLLMTRGYAAPEVERTFARAHELSRAMEDTPELVFLLGGLFRFFFVRAQFERARALGEQALQLAERCAPSLRVVGHTLIGLPALSVGDLATARMHLERGLARYEFEQHRWIASQHGDDPAVTSLAFLSIALWFLGHPDAALERSREARALAERLDAPFARAFAWCFAAWIHVRRGEVAAAEESCARLIALATEQGFPFFAAEGRILLGWVRAERGDLSAAVDGMRSGLAEHRAAGAAMGRPGHLALLAEACARLGRIDEGLAALDEAFASVASTGERSYEAELHRLQGELRLRAAGRREAREADAAAAFRRALAIARGQGAVALELRAATALVRTARSRREREGARRVLAEVHGRFGEGHGTADLVAARAVLQ